jgi:DNA-binding MarR family transcriptional regulator
MADQEEVQKISAKEIVFASKQLAPAQEDQLRSRLISLGIAEEEIKFIFSIYDLANWVHKYIGLAAHCPGAVSEEQQKLNVQKHLEYHLKQTREDIDGFEEELKRIIKEVFEELPEEIQQLAVEIVHLGIPIKDFYEVIEKRIFMRYARKILDAPVSRMDKIRGMLLLIKKVKAFKKKRKVTKKYATLKRLRMLATFLDGQDIAARKLAEESEITYDKALIALREMKKEGWVVCSPSPTDYKEKLWRITPKGMTVLFSHTTFLNCDLQEIYRKAQFKDADPSQHGNSLSEKFNKKEISEFLAKAQKVTHELELLGWNGPRARRILPKHKVDHLLGRIEEVKGNAEVKNKGAYLYKILYNQVSNETRINALCEKVLQDLREDAREMYRHLAKGLEPKQYVYLAYSLRKLHQRCEDVSVGDVRGVLGWIFKREQGLTMWGHWKGRKKRQEKGKIAEATPKAASILPAKECNVIVPERLDIPYEAQALLSCGQVLCIQTQREAQVLVCPQALPLPLTVESSKSLGTPEITMPTEFPKSLPIAETTAPIEFPKPLVTPKTSIPIEPMDMGREQSLAQSEMGIGVAKTEAKREEVDLKPMQVQRAMPIQRIIEKQASKVAKSRKLVDSEEFERSSYLFRFVLTYARVFWNVGLRCQVDSLEEVIPKSCAIEQTRQFHLGSSDVLMKTPEVQASLSRDPPGR